MDWNKEEREQAAKRAAAKEAPATKEPVTPAAPPLTQRQRHQNSADEINAAYLRGELLTGKKTKKQKKSW